MAQVEKGQRLVSGSKDRVQVNVRIPSRLADMLDDERVQKKQEIGKIPSRSEVIRWALEDYLSEGNGDTPATWEVHSGWAGEE
jgi:metal-responsive CopG/Arc/MetJ family transcriptional regulator